MGGKSLRIHLPGLRVGPSPKNLHKNTESPGNTPEKIKNQTSDLHRRHADSSKVSKRNRNSKGHNPLPLTKPGVPHKLGKICTNPKQDNGLPRNKNRLRGNDFLDPKPKDQRTNLPLPKSHSVPKNITKEPSQHHWQTQGNSPSILTSPPSSKISPKSSEGKSEVEIIRITDSPVHRSPTRTKVVEGEPINLQCTGETTENPTPRNDCSIRRSRGPTGGMGSSYPGNDNWRGLDPPREETPHQYTRNDGSRNGHQNIYQGENGEVYSPASGQYDSPPLHPQNGGNKKCYTNRNNEKDLGIPSIQWDHTYCGIHPLKTEQISRLGITEHTGFQRVETKTSNISKGLPHARETPNRPLCISGISPTTQVYELEDGPKQRSSKCTTTGLESNVPICIPPIQPDRPDTEKGPKTQNTDDPYNPNLGSSTLVPPTSGNGHTQPNHPTTHRRAIIKPTGNDPPTTKKWNPKTRGMADLRRRMQNSGLSKSASRLIINSRSAGTRSNYNTAWEKFSSWCHQQQVDPFRCSLNCILNYLAHLFDTKKAYRTINNYRSAISSLHEPIDGLPAGQHPKVKALLKGISKERPPLPKYSFVWDVEQVLQYIKNNMQNNNELTPKDLTQKLICLMGLTAISRGSELHALSLKGICKINNSYEMFPIGNLKHSKQGKSNPPISFHAFSQDRSLCPVECIDKYLSLTQQWRGNLTREQKDSFWLSFAPPHKPVSKSTITRWIMSLLGKAGIDTKTFKSHSLRSASSSKVSKAGLTTTDILKRGNWKGISVWEKHYHNDIVTPSERYSTTLLNSVQQGKALNEA